MALFASIKVCSAKVLVSWVKKGLLAHGATFLHIRKDPQATLCPGPETTSATTATIPCSQQYRNFPVSRSLRQELDSSLEEASALRERFRETEARFTDSSKDAAGVVETTRGELTVLSEQRSEFEKRVGELKLRVEDLQEVVVVAALCDEPTTDASIQSSEGLARLFTTGPLTSKLTPNCAIASHRKPLPRP